MIPKEILKKVKKIQIRANYLVNNLFAGHYQSVFKGQGMEFLEVREYVPGDDIRSIDWNVTARTGNPFIKKFMEERENTIMLMVDVSASNRFGSESMLKKDLAAEVAAVFAFSAIKNNDRVGLILFAEDVELYIPPSKGVRHVLRLVREVLYFTPKKTGSNPVSAIEFFNRVTKNRSICFMISDFIYEDNFEIPLKLAAKKHDFIAMIIKDKREIFLPKAGLVYWQDAETGEQVLVDTSDPNTAKKLTILEKEKAYRIKQIFSQVKIDSIELWTGVEYEKELIKFFKIRQERRGR